MKLTTLLTLLTLSLTQTTAFLLSIKWKYDPASNRCWTIPLLMWGKSDPNCPIPAPDPKAIAQKKCTGKTPGSVPLFLANGDHYACAMPSCSPHPTLPALLGECMP